MDELKDFGLSENEILVYVTLLKLGQVSANSVSKISGLKRSTTYDNLQILITKGIASSCLKSGVHYYTAAEPQKLVHMLEDKVKRINAVIPALESLSKTIPKSRGVTYYEGKKGVLSVLNDVLDYTKTEFHFIGSRKMAKIPLAHYPDNFAVRRVEANLFARGYLAQEDKEDSFLDGDEIQKLSSFKFKKELDGGRAIMFLYEDKVSFITNKVDPVGIIIHDADVASFLKSVLFDKVN